MTIRRLSMIRAGRPASPARVLAVGSALTAALALGACSSSGAPSSGAPSSGGTSGSAASTGSTPAASASSEPASSAAAGASSAAPVQSLHAGGDFCSLVTATEARAVAGEELAPGVSRTGTTPQIGGRSGSCLYKPAHPKTLTVVNLIVIGTKVPQSLFDTEITQNANKSTPVSGLGETAFALPGIVTVYDHGLVLALEIIKGGNPVPTTTLAALLRAALSRAGGLR